MSPLKALTLWQPWAHAIAHLGKWIENRTWAPPASAIGEPLAIHAGKKLDREVAEDFGLRPDEIPIGCVVAVARLERVICSKGDVPADQRLWWNGPIGWLLADVQAIEPIPCRGAQGLWELPAEVEAAVVMAVRRAKASS